MADDKKYTVEATKAIIEKMRTPLDMGQLWCVHVIGPNTFFAQPSRLLAEARAKLWQSSVDQRVIQDPSPHDPVLYCYATIWGGSAESHAADLASHNGEPEDIC